MLELWGGSGCGGGQPDQRGLVGRIRGWKNALDYGRARRTSFLLDESPLSWVHARPLQRGNVRFEYEAGPRCEGKNLGAFRKLRSGLRRAAHDDAALGDDDGNLNQVVPGLLDRPLRLPPGERIARLTEQQLGSLQGRVGFERRHGPDRGPRVEPVADTGKNCPQHAREGCGDDLVRFAPPLPGGLNLVLEGEGLKALHPDRNDRLGGALLLAVPSRAGAEREQGGQAEKGERGNQAARSYRHGIPAS